jgi:hypothetical protein
MLAQAIACLLQSSPAAVLLEHQSLAMPAYVASVLCSRKGVSDPPLLLLLLCWCCYYNKMAHR